MARTWYKSDTAADNSGNKCYTETIATNPFYTECQLTDPSPSGSNTITLPLKQSYMIGAYESGVGIGVTSIPAGTWYVNIYVTGAAGGGSYFDRVDICEITPAGSNVKTIATWTGNITIDTTGAKQIPVSIGSPVSVTSTNHWYIQVSAYSNIHAGTSVSINRTLTIVDTVTVAQEYFRSATVSATATIAGAGWKQTWRTASISAAALIEAIAARTFYRTVSIIATSSIASAAETVTKFRTATVSASLSVLSAGEKVTRYVTATVSPVCTIASDAFKQTWRTASIVATADVAGIAHAVRYRTATIVSALTVEAVGAIGHLVSATISAALSILSTGEKVTKFRTASITPVCSIEAAAAKHTWRTASVAAISNIASAAYAKRYRTATISSSSLVSAQGFAQKFRTAVVQGIGAIQGIAQKEGTHIRSAFISGALSVHAEVPKETGLRGWKGWLAWIGWKS